MPLYPTLQPLPPASDRKAAGLQNIENATWQAFRRLNLSHWTTLYYNVHVGTVAGDDENAPPAARLLHATLYAKRVDVIARAHTETWIIEVKNRALANAIGQVLVYPPLVNTRCPDWAPFRTMLVAASCDPDVAATAATYGVEVYCAPFFLLPPRR
jgi:hypothetical protein